MAPPDLSPPSGTRDFFAGDVRRRESAISTIKRVFETFGFEPLETPALERIEVLAGKYGEDEKLIFKIAKRGAKEAEGEADLALRYDFTVPLARVVAGHDLRGAFPFKRYQIGPVWRADRAARGRFREFFQCDVDVVGSESLLADAEVMLAAAECLRALGVADFVINLNSREVLRALMEAYEVPPAAEGATLAALDKLYKIGPDGVASELRTRGLPERVVTAIQADQQGDGPLERLLSTERGKDAYAELTGLEDLVAGQLRSGRVVFAPYIARGLDYYTGSVFEFYLEREGDHAEPLSIASGGRYDDLIGMFSNRRVPAVGVSLGFERLLLLLEERDEASAAVPQVLVCLWDESFRADALALAMELREAGLSAEPFLESTSLKAQLRYASRRGVALCLIYGPDERASGQVAVKDMGTGEQRSVPRDQLTDAVRRQLEERPAPQPSGEEAPAASATR